MTEPAEQPLLDEQTDEPKKTPKRRTTAAAKPRAAKTTKAVKAAEAESTPKTKKPAKAGKTTKATKVTKVAKPKAATRKKAAKAEPETGSTNGAVAGDLFERAAAAPSAPASTPKAEPAATPPKVEAKTAASEGEEWRPSARRNAAPEDHAPEPTAAQPSAETSSPIPAAAPATSEIPAALEIPSTPAPAGARRYPVYIPRAVAKQLESEGKEVPIAVMSADELPKDILDAVAAATPAQPERPPHREREDRRHQHPRDRDRERSHSHGQRSQEEVMPEPMTSEVTAEELGEGEGIIEISGKGFGFIRDAKRGFAQTPNDIFVTPELVRTYNLRDGQWLKGQIRRGGRGAQLHKLLEINGDDPATLKNLPAFDELTVTSPDKKIRLETVPDRYTTRIIDMFCPIGKGQRGLIVAPPRTGKTTLLQHIADAVIKNHPEIKLMILLVDERPEEVTDIRRNLSGAEIFASSNDMDVKSHTRIAQLCIERARRLVEQGKDVFILLDSITRVGRAFNNAMAGGGRTGSGGLDTRAMEIPRRLFAAARNTEEAGSLTIVATALIDTNSRMDDIIFQEFKGTGNMELVLDRRIAEQRIYPAIDIFLSGTRREELLLGEEDLRKLYLIRRGLAGYKAIEAIERLLFFAKKFPTNAQMLAGIPG